MAARTAPWPPSGKGPTDVTNEDIDRRFDHHPPSSQAKADLHAKLRANCKAAALAFTEELPPSRELSLAITKLEEAMFWANAALAREGN